MVTLGFAFIDISPVWMVSLKMISLYVYKSILLFLQTIKFFLDSWTFYKLLRFEKILAIIVFKSFNNEK